MDPTRLTEVVASAQRLLAAQDAAGPAAPPPEAIPPDVVLRELEALVTELRAGVDSARRQAQVHHVRYQELFEFAPDGYLVTDRFGVIEEANQAAAGLLQARKEFLVGKPLAFFVAEGRAHFYTRLNQLTRQPDVVQEWEVALRPRGQELVQVRVAATAFYTTEGAPVRLRWLLHDVSQSRRAEHSLQEEKTFGDTLLDTAQAVILVVDAGGRIVRSNAYLWRLSGLGERQLRGNDWSLLVPEVERPLAREALRRAQGSLAGATASWSLVGRDGSPRTFAWSVRTLSLEIPHSGVLLLGHDITELEAAQCRALQVERLAAIGQMMTGLSHESRNALQRTQACLEMLQLEIAGQSRALDLVGRIQKAQEELHRLYEEVQSYAAPLRLDCRLRNLAAVWREAWALLASLYPARVVEIREETGAIDLCCEVDAGRLRQVFRNLLENALAACPDPVRIVMTCAHALLGGRPALRVAMRDSGPGLTPEQRRKVFEPFYTTKIKGTGLGLAICRRIVEAHGGVLTAGEADGPGAEFIITLPRRAP